MPVTSDLSLPLSFLPSEKQMILGQDKDFLLFPHGQEKGM
jgi:hypothetical protein